MGRWAKGQSGNPNGRPPKQRAWTKILEAAGNKKEKLPDGSQVARKKILAELIMQGVTNGVVTLPTGKTLTLSPKDWLDMVWKVYGQVDGPPRAEVDVTSGGERVQGPIVYLPAIDDETSGDE
jgi:hypothetical protein